MAIASGWSNIVSGDRAVTDLAISTAFLVIRHDGSVGTLDIIGSRCNDVEVNISKPNTIDA